MLAWVGSRCRIRAEAMRVSAGKAWRICVKASTPPAEAPMPTTGQGAPTRSGDSSLVGGSEGGGGATRERRRAMTRDRLPLDFLLATLTSRCPTREERYA